MNRIEVNVVTGEQTVVDLMLEEIAALPAPQSWRPDRLMKVVKAGREIALNRLAGMNN